MTANNSASNSGYRLAGTFIVVEALLSLAPLGILGPAIGWPASLGSPAAQQLAAIAAQPGAVAAGYGVYLLYSLLILPAMVLVTRHAAGDASTALARIAVGFTVASMLARCIGILRWLTVMPVLAQAHGAAAPEARATIELLFSAVTLYGGGIGEVLGVSLLMSLSLGFAMAAAWQAGLAPAWLTLSGLVTALALGALSLPALGIAIRLPTAAPVSLLALWMIAFGVWLTLRPRR